MEAPRDRVDAHDIGEQATSPQSEEERRARFARIFATHDRWLYAYLISLLGNAADAEEVFQETCVVIWKEYERFDLSTNFVKWAAVVAHHQVLTFRRKQIRDRRFLSLELVNLLAAEAIERSSLMEDRRAALDGCLQKLRSSDRDLIAACYSDTQTRYRDVAAKLNRPENTVYKALARIRRSLHDCIDRRLTTGGAA
ncbi:ECF RNA polymerase sigma factor SigH [Posidoniimonas polymericola]|uniref:ECF RNA polymerase sigma factor SigH n=1 Tax=Posidoniimonas polymericola TaxID=2528002 RepID=A0A5C5YL73_9BACT|nr:sigma-70 family RNA polymerase sigma factor [Posidoniimonas polymericola]TWT75683.1 ECF RNA polymerase sigma factor SigH [Posidoniimonas polymericola]